MTRRLIIASGNRHKIDELRAMVAASGHSGVRALEVLSVGELPEYGPPPEIEETEDTFVGNAMLKADGIAGWLRMAGAAREDIVIADDSGLCVDAFEGAPGVYSARFAGLDASDADNNARLVRELEARGLARSPAEYVCVLAVRRVGARPFDFTVPDHGAIFMRDNCLCIEGRVRGEVRPSAQGSGGFGYDPYFWMEGEERTFADISQADKAARSHRGSAMRRFMQELPNCL